MQDQRGALLYRQGKKQRVFAIGGTIFNQRTNAAVLSVQQAGIRYAMQRGGDIIFSKLWQHKTDFTAGIKLPLDVTLPGRVFAGCRHRRQHTYPE